MPKAFDCDDVINTAHVSMNRRLQAWRDRDVAKSLLFVMSRLTDKVCVFLTAVKMLLWKLSFVDVV